MTAILNLLACLLLSVSAGLAACSYVNILTQPGMILSFWAKWLYGIRDWYVGGDEIQTDDEQVAVAFFNGKPKRERIADYILKPILTCVYCVGGQMGFWLSLYYKLQYDTSFSIMSCLLTSVIAVYMGGALQYIQQKYFPL